METGNSILLVDESKVFLNLYRQFLRTTPAEIREARSAAAAMQECRSSRPNLIYMSYDLPDANGADCCRQLKRDARLRSVPVILICDQNDPLQQASCQQAECNGVLTKPVDKIRFLDVGRSFLLGIREIRRPCRVTVQCVRDGQRLTTRGLDISSGGIFLAGCEGLALNASLALEIELGLERQVVCSGEVAWINRREKPFKASHPAGIGVRFTEMSIRDSGILADYLETLGFKVGRGEPG